MSRPVLLDLFCGAGGAGMGYHRAGFEVVGVDIAPQPNYPFPFYCRDAIEILAALVRYGHVFGQSFEAVHASPPCQPHSSLTGWGQSRRVSNPKPDLIPVTRDLLVASGLPYVIENVEGSDLRNAIRICGQGLGLRVRRHRRFESNVPMLGVPCYHPEPPVIVVRGSIGRKVFDPRRRAIAPSLALAREVMEMPWADAGGLADAIPPAYAEHVGRFLMAEVKARLEVAV